MSFVLTIQDIAAILETLDTKEDIIKRIRNKVIQGNIYEILKYLPDNSINCVITSPPYWSLRDYNVDSLIWDDDPNCKHEFNIKNIHHDNLRFRDPNHIAQVGNNRNEEIYNDPKTKSGFCSKCGAWKGCLGLEPTFELYIKHLCDIFDEIKRVLRKDGTCWVNLGDTYAGGGRSGSKEYFEKGHIH